jgi:hypothetical protein
MLPKRGELLGQMLDSTGGKPPSVGIRHTGILDFDIILVITLAVASPVASRTSV